MKCPKCVEEGEKSQVYPGLTSVTCMGYQPYYDEAGCGACDYGKDEDQITMEAEE
jgi:hypothetical protein